MLAGRLTNALRSACHPQLAIQSRCGDRVKIRLALWYAVPSYAEREVILPPFSLEEAGKRPMRDTTAAR